MPNMENKKPEESWLIKVESSLEGESRADISDDGFIHSVPKSLLSENTKVFYLPQLISLGPYHFEIKENLDDDMELLKSKVARKMHRKIKDGLKSSGKVESCNLQEGQEDRNESGLKSVVEKLKDKEVQEKIKKSYANKNELSSEVWAWMIVRDACVVLDVLDRFRKDDHAETHDPLLTEIVKDMLKMENQLPFWALETIRNDIEGSKEKNDFWFESALKNLSPIEVAAEGPIREYTNKSHILQLLHAYIVDKQVTAAPKKQPLRASRSQSGRSWITIIKKYIKSIKPESIGRCLCSCIKRPFRLLGRAVLLLFSFVVFVMLFIWGIIFVILYGIKNNLFVILYHIKNCISPKGEEIEQEIGKHVPTAEELKRVGVRFKKLEGDKIGISHIEFKESNSTLYLPKFKVDNRSEIILRNLIALEICSKNQQKPISRYVVLMNDLINTSGDVGILRREDIITGKLGSDDEIAQFWNSMVTSTEMARYDTIDRACSPINRYHKKWGRGLVPQFIELLIEFVMVHCSKPWLFLSLLAGLILLLLTLVQVVCLFDSCQLK